MRSADRIDGFARKKAHAALSRLPATQQWRVTRRLKQIPESTRGDLADAGLTRTAVAVTRASGDRGVRFLKRAEPATVRQLRGTPRRYKRAVVRAYTETDISEAKLRNTLGKVKGLGDVPRQRTRRLVSATQGKALQYIGDTESSTLTQLLTSSELTVTDLASLGRRYADLDSTQRQQLRGLIDRNGPEGVRLASDFDSETLGDFLTPDCASPTGGAATSVASDSDRVFSAGETSVAIADCGPTYRQYQDFVTEANDAVEDFDARGFHADVDDLDPETRERVREALADREVDVDSTYVTEGVPEAVPLNDFTDLDGIDAEDIVSLELQIRRHGENLEYDDLRELESDLRELKSPTDSSESVDGLGESMRSATPSPENQPGTTPVSNMKGFTGEVRVTDGLLDAGVDSDYIEMERNIGRTQIEAEYNEDVADEVATKTNFKRLSSDTDIDAAVDSEVTIGGESFQSPAVEVKNRLPTVPEGISTFKEDLVKKISTQAAAGEDEFVVAVPEEYLEARGDRLTDLEQEVTDNLKDLDDSVGSDTDIDTEVTIKVVSIESLE